MVGQIIVEPSSSSEFHDKATVQFSKLHTFFSTSARKASQFVARRLNKIASKVKCNFNTVMAVAVMTALTVTNPAGAQILTDVETAGDAFDTVVGGGSDISGLAASGGRILFMLAVIGLAIGLVVDLVQSRGANMILFVGGLVGLLFAGAIINQGETMIFG